MGLGIIQQRRPSKNLLFGHPPPRSNIVGLEDTPSSPRPQTSGPYRTKTSETQRILRSGRPWMGVGGGVTSESETQNTTIGPDVFDGYISTHRY